MERLKLLHDEAWQQLVDAGVVRPSETEEYLRTFASGMQQQAEEDQAWEAVQRAIATGKQVYISTQLSARHLSIPGPERVRRLREATHKVRTAEAKMESIRKRNDLISDFLRGTYDFKMAKEDVANLQTLLPWVSEQIPLIEAEMSQLKATEDRSRGTKRSLDYDSDSDNSPGRAFKMPKLDHHKSCSLLSNGTATRLTENKPDDLVSFATDNEKSLSRDTSPIPQAEESPARPSRDALAACQAKPQQLRRSARLVARQVDRTTEVTLGLKSSYPRLRPGLQMRSLRRRSPIKSAKAPSARIGAKSHRRRNSFKPRITPKRGGYLQRRNS